jgi:hypothetical protein
MNGGTPFRAPFHPVGGVGWALIQIGFAAAMTLGHVYDYTSPWPVVVAVAASGVVAGIALSARWHRTLVGKAISLLWLPLIWLVGEQVQPPLPELSALWPAIAALLAMGLVAMSGAPRWAWVMTALVTLLCVAWGESHGVALSTQLEQLANLTPVIGGTIYRLVMRRARDGEAAAREEHAEAIQQLGMIASQAEARREYRTRIIDLAGELFDRMANGAELSPGERTECRLLEAGLRDGIRGRGLATREVAQAARAARERGVTVTLIDDRAPDCKEEVARAVLNATRLSLERAQAGDTCVARLLPAGRRNVATVLLVTADGEGVRREFAPPPGGLAPAAVERPPITLSG